MGALPAGWTVEDDVLLMNAVEAGDSLESLAKGAICFSHKFTLQELQDRWHSLLYDSETSAQASSCMAKYETELSTSTPAKANKLFNSNAKDFVLCKRKIDSVKNQYYAMRKRVCLEPCLSADFGSVIAPCSCIPVDGGGCACGGCSEGRLLVHKVDPSGAIVNRFGLSARHYEVEGQHVHSNGNGHNSFHTEHVNADVSTVIDGNTNYENPHGYSDGYDYMQKNPQATERNISSLDNRSDLSGQYDGGATGSRVLLGTNQDDVKLDRFSQNSTGGLLEPVSVKVISQKCFQAPSIPTWSKVQGINSPDMLTDMHRNKQETLMLSDDNKMETTNSGTPAFQEVLHGGISVPGLCNAMVSECVFMHSRLNGFSQKEDLELLTEHFTDPALDRNQEDLDNFHTKVFLKTSSRGHHLSPFDATDCGNHIDPIHKQHNVAAVSEVDTMPTSSEVLYPGCDVRCTLNTADPEIPSVDHVLIPGQSPLETKPTCDQDSQHNVCLVPTKPSSPQDADDCNHTDRTLTMMINMEHVEPSPSPPIKLEPAILEENKNMMSLNGGCLVGRLPPGMHVDIVTNSANMCMSDLHSANGEETTCSFVQHECLENLHNLTLDKSIQVPDQMTQMNCKIVDDNTKIDSEITTQSCDIPSHALPKMEFYNPIASISTSGTADGSDSENGVPNYFDLESLILDQELIPWGQESDFTQPEVSRFHYPESRKDLIRLEKGAFSYMNRSIMSKGAFAILYGQHLKYYIRDPEVTLGRETEDVHVDIDLGKEGRANKISRRQAVIIMDDGGSFYIKNIGRCSIFVNSKEVPFNKRINLISDSLVEIRDMKFIFHVNQGAVRQHIIRTRRGSYLGENTVFEWNQNP
ncbi:hypothetical protein ACP70R_014764 [Stipagrostis hirtigluma subsp. patula]